MVKVGDRLVVQGMPFAAYVERIEEDLASARTVLHLDWKEHGKSRVYLHDENKTWYKYTNAN
jgi:ketopantoate hydroxymethyltransferase